jgi:hypothetical protein
MIPTITYTTYTEHLSVSSDAQKALIVWDKKSQTLHLQSSFRGPAADFAWVIPVPARPAVERSDWRLFEMFEGFTRPVVKITFIERRRGGAKAGREDVTAPQQLQTKVRRLESFDIRELHIDVVEANDAGDFVHWLRNNDYSVSKEAEPVLMQYIAKNFYFVVCKINKESLWARAKGMTEVVSGGLTPLAITFESERPFYPLAISAISSAPENELLLLTLAPQRLVPREYGCTELTEADIEQVVFYNRPMMGRGAFAMPIDLAEAAKVAQQRLTQPGLIVECAANIPRPKGRLRRLLGPHKFSGKSALCVTRFHSVLKPTEMKDITFVPAAWNYVFDGRFHIILRR